MTAVSEEQETPGVLAIYGIYAATKHCTRIPSRLCIQYIPYFNDTTVSCRWNSWKNDGSIFFWNRSLIAYKNCSVEKMAPHSKLKHYKNCVGIWSLTVCTRYTWKWSGEECITASNWKDHRQGRCRIMHSNVTIISVLWELWDKYVGIFLALNNSSRRDSYVALKKYSKYAATREWCEL